MTDLGKLAVGVSFAAVFWLLAGLTYRAVTSERERWAALVLALAALAWLIFAVREIFA